MKKIVIIEQDEIEDKNNVFEKLFLIREEQIESFSKERNQYIRENNLRDVTHDMLINEIENNFNVEEKSKKKILSMLDKLLENRARILSFNYKMYYKAGINDVVDIIFSEK